MNYHYIPDLGPCASINRRCVSLDASLEAASETADILSVCLSVSPSTLLVIHIRGT
jgi:hypothetical protein